MSTSTPVALTSIRPGVAMRVLRVAVLAAVGAGLSGCALWNSIFGDAPAPAEPAPAAQTQPVVPETPPPPPPAPEPAVPAPVYTPAAPAAEIPPPSPLPKVAEPAAPAKTMAVSTGPGFYINVGLFAVPTNGSNAVSILRGASLPVFADTVESATKGSLTRVRVGPYATRVEALAAAKKIKGLKLDAVVFERK